MDDGFELVLTLFEAAGVTMKKFAVLFFLCLAISQSPAETILKEFRSSLGVAQLFLPPQAPRETQDTVENLFKDVDTSETETSIRALALPGGTLLLVSFQDAHSGEEIRFPVRVSQVQRFLRSQSKRHRTGSREERIVAGIRDLSRNLKVRMRTNQESEDSK